jgi:hypothetical protein
MQMQRLFVRVNYLYQLYPVFFMNIAFATLRLHRHLKSGASRYLQYSLAGAAIVVCVPLFLLSAAQTGYDTYKRYFVDGRTTKEFTWAYIRSLPADSKVYYMPGVAMSPEYRKASGHAWRSCRTIDGLRANSSDYLFVDWKFANFNAEPISIYLKVGNYTLVDKIKPEVRLAEVGAGTDSDPEAEADMKVETEVEPKTKVPNILASMLPVETIKRTGDCLESIGSAYPVNANDALVAHQYEIY